MTAMADFITHRWPNSPVADEAWMMRIRTAMVKQRHDEGARVPGRIADDSPRRGDAELMTGQAFWNVYLEARGFPRSNSRQKTK